MHHLSNLLFFGIPLLYYYINLNSSIICCLSCGDIYLSFGISLLASFDDNSFEWNSFGDFFEELVILSAIFIANSISNGFCCFFELLFLKEFLFHLLHNF